MIRLLEASTVAYTKAKTWEIFITYVLITLAFAYPITYLVAKNEDVKLILFICSFGLTVIVQIFMDTFKGNTSKGALFKEEFDVALFGLPWKSTLTAPVDSDIEKLSAQYKGNPIKDWYSLKLSPSIPTYTAIAILQHSNTSWDIKLRQRYRDGLIRFMCIYSLLLGGMILIMKASPLMTFLLLFSVLSFYTHFISLIRAHDGVIKKREAISKHLDELIQNKKQISVSELRDVQDEIYLTRLESTKVPNFFFRLHQKEMNEVAERYIQSVNTLYG